MKHTFFNFFFFCVCLLGLGACSAPEGFRLEGKLSGFADGSKANLKLSATHQDEKTEMRTVLENGCFTFMGNLPEPRLYLLTIEEPSGACAYHTLMLENGNICITAVKGEERDNRIALEEVKVKGSAADKLFHEKMAFRSELNRMFEEKNRKFQEISGQLTAARVAGDNKKLDSLMKTEAYAALTKAENDFFATAERMIPENIKANGDSFWGPLLMLYNYNYFTPNDAKNQSIFNGFSETAQNSFYGQLLKKQLFTESLLGKPLPAFTLPDRNGKEIAVNTLLKDKKCVLIDFWASWCAPCRKSIPTLKAIYKQAAKQGLEIVSISIDKKKADWLKALDEEKLPWPCLLDTQNVFKEKFDGRAVPTFVLVDGNGNVIGENLEVKDLEIKIREQL